MKKQLLGTVKEIQNIAKGTYKLVIKSDSDEISAGQFISILCNTTLRRPFSVSNYDKKNNLITVLFKLKGKGTNYLKNLKINDEINFLSPLGNSFPIENKKCLLIGAGIGIAPMLYLKKMLDEKNIKNYLISGFKEENEIISGSDKNIIGGSVLDNIENLILEEKFEVIYSCGPKIVLEKISEITKKLQIPSYLALEKVMACSVGVCRGCVIKLFKNNEIKYYSVCKDGPVFKGDEIIWE